MSQGVDTIRVYCAVGVVALWSAQFTLRSRLSVGCWFKQFLSYCMCLDKKHYNDIKGLCGSDVALILYVETCILDEIYICYSDLSSKDV